MPSDEKSVLSTCSQKLFFVETRMVLPLPAAPRHIPGALARLKGWLCLFDACLSVLLCHLLRLLGLPSGQPVS